MIVCPLEYSICEFLQWFEKVIFTKKQTLNIHMHASSGGGSSGGGTGGATGGSSIAR